MKDLTNTIIFIIILIILTLVHGYLEAGDSASVTIYGYILPKEELADGSEVTLPLGEYYNETEESSDDHVLQVIISKP